MKKRKEWRPNRYIASALRRIWRWSPERKKIKNETRFCCSCKKRLNPKRVKVDHIQPVGSVPKGFEGWDTYLSRLFCPISNLQGLCKSCHAKKTKEEGRIRRLNAKAKSVDA